jgi:cell wall-associated NlpC family hydrolase
MPTTTTRHARAHLRSGRLRRLAVAAALAGGGIAGAFAPAGPVSAERAATSSTTIARKAQGAVDALGAWRFEHSPADYLRFVRARDAVADMLAHELSLPADDLRADLSAPAITNQHAALAALSQLGVSYRSMASEKGVGFDCSGLTSFAYAAAGVEVPRVSGDQMRAAERVDREDAEVGDLVHYPGHVGMFLGGNIYVHSPQPGHDVEVVVMPDRSLSFGDLTP